MKRLAIIGSGDLAQQLAYHTQADNQFQVIGFFDDFVPKGEIKNNYPILGKTSEIESSFKKGIFDCILIGIGYNHLDFRKNIFLQLEGKIPFATFIHSSNLIDSSVVIREGSIIYAGCNLDMNVKIGKNTILYNGCVVAHDSKIGAHCIISPAVKIAGFCKIGNSVNLGIGTIISDSISLIEKTKTGAGAVVVKSTLEAGLYIGLPAKLVTL